MTHEPVRLLHDAAAGAALRRDLGAVARVDAAYDVSAGLARFEGNLAAGTGVARTGGASGGVVAGALLLVGGLAAALMLWPSADPPPAVAVGSGVAAPAPAIVDDPPPAPAVAIEAPTPTAAVAEPEAAPAAPLEEDIEIDEAPVARPGKRTRPRPAAADKKPAPAADYLREARNLQTARGLLGRDAARALELAEAGHAEFRGGTFEQEWEGVAILALFELGRPEARARGEAFLRSYPSGTYAPRVRQAMGL